MKSINFTLIAGVLTFSTLQVKAEIPKTPELKDYTNLLERSPFKIKGDVKVEKVEKEAPPEPEPEPEVSKDYELRGVTKMQDLWMIVMVDVKKPTENIIIKQGSASDSKLKLVGVTQDVDDYTLTSATIEVGDELITINYNKEHLAANYKEVKSSSSDGRGGDRGRGERGSRDKERDKERRERYERYMRAKREQRERQ